MTWNKPITDRDTAHSFAEHLHGLLVALTQHLRRETEALSQGVYTRLAVDKETKSDLLFAYRTGLSVLQEHKDLISRFVPVKLEEVRRMHEAFQAELQKNLATVSTAKAVSEQLLSRLADQVSSNARPKTYGASGTIAKGAAAAAISVDRAL